MRSRDSEKQREYWQKHYARNREKYINKAAIYKKKLVDYIREAKNKPCADCNVSYPYYVMDFDHRTDKLYSVANMFRNKGLQQIKKEIAKCDVVCANCHRIRTHIN